MTREHLEKCRNYIKQSFNSEDFNIVAAEEWEIALDHIEELQKENESLKSRLAAMGVFG